jgi:pseudaminic acid cytidylyltransferase
MNIAIIPARGGSQRIPRKNIRDFCGKPIISYPIKTAIDSNLFDEIAVLTDDLEIAEIAKKYGATIPYYRNATTANNNATLAEVINEAIVNYEYQGKKVDLICCILPTAVFVQSQQLTESFEQMEYYDGITSVCKFKHPVERSLKVTSYLNFMFPENETIRTQDFTPTYYDAGQFYWIRVKSFKEQQKIFMRYTKHYELDAIDIDSEEDWKLAEETYKIRSKNN